MTVGVLTAALVSPVAASAAKLLPAQVRVNQVGYATSAPKVAYAMLPRKVASDYTANSLLAFALGAAGLG